MLVLPACSLSGILEGYLQWSTCALRRNLIPRRARLPPEPCPWSFTLQIYPEYTSCLRDAVSFVISHCYYHMRVLISPSVHGHSPYAGMIIPERKWAAEFGLGTPTVTRRRSNRGSTPGL